MEQVECGKDAYTRQKKVCDLRIERIFRERFETQEEAKRFIDGCPEGVCKDWEIDEVHE